MDRSDRGNNFGVLRLLFAILVIVGHVPVMIDGNYSRELLYQTVGSESFSGLGVDCFFTISGYLITKSFLSASNTLPRYIASRVLRIYPGYIVACLISIYVFGFFAGGDLSRAITPFGILRELGRMALLLEPHVPGAFANMPDTALNGPMWSLAQEFRCYVMVMIFGFLGIYSRKLIYICILVVCALLLTHYSFAFFRMASIFLFGSAYYIFRAKIVYTLPYAGLALVVWGLFLHYTPYSELATATIFPYVIFFLAFNIKSARLNSVGRNTDISYGLYLYAFPISNLLIMHYPGVSPWIVIGETIVLASIPAYLSWRLIESQALKFKDYDWTRLLPKGIGDGSFIRRPTRVRN